MGRDPTGSSGAVGGQVAHAAAGRLPALAEAQTGSEERHSQPRIDLLGLDPFSRVFN